MVGQRAVRQEAGREEVLGLAQGLLEGGLIAGLGEEGGAADGPVEDVVDEAAGGAAPTSGHGGKGSGRQGGVKDSTPDPFSFRG